MLGKVASALEDGVKMRNVPEKLKGGPEFNSLKCNKGKFRVVSVSSTVVCSP